MTTRASSRLARFTWTDGQFEVTSTATPKLRHLPGKHDQKTHGGGRIPTDASYWKDAKQISGAMGSNPGGVYEHPDGRRYYVKFTDDTARAKTEMSAQAIYELADVAVPNSHLITVDGKQALASEIAPDLKQVTLSELHSRLMADPKQAAAISVASILTQNWDVVGGGGDNLLISKEGHLTVIDTGGSFTYRARGKTKPYSTSASELDTFEDAGRNPTAAAVFKGIYNNPATIDHAIDTARMLRDAAPSMVAPGVPRRDFQAKADDLINRLEARRAKLAPPTPRPGTTPGTPPAPPTGGAGGAYGGRTSVTGVAIASKPASGSKYSTIHEVEKGDRVTYTDKKTGSAWIGEVTGKHKAHEGTLVVKGSDDGKTRYLGWKSVEYIRTPGYAPGGGTIGGGGTSAPIPGGGHTLTGGTITGGTGAGHTGTVHIPGKPYSGKPYSKIDEVGIGDLVKSKDGSWGGVITGKHKHGVHTFAVKGDDGKTHYPSWKTLTYVGPKSGGGVATPPTGGGTVTKPRVPKVPPPTSGDIPTDPRSHIPDHKARVRYSAEVTLRAAGTPRDEIDKKLDEVSAHLQKLVDNADIISNRRYHDAKLILRDGRFKSQFETGKSEGTFSPGYRSKVEHDEFGIPKSLDKTQRTIYGSLHDSGSRNDARRYGDVVFFMKDHVRDRATFTGADSFASGSDMGASPLRAASWESLHWGRGRTDPTTVPSIGAARGLSSGYAEVQIHGGLKVSEVRKMVFTGAAPDAEMIRLMDGHGIPWEHNLRFRALADEAVRGPMTLTDAVLDFLKQQR